MNQRQENHSKFGRREFVGSCALAVAAGGRLWAAEEEAVPTLGYKAVPGWAKLPADVPFVGVNGLDVDSKGRVYAAGGEENAILVFAPSGKLLQAWGKGTIEGKHGVRVFNDRVYVADTSLHQMHEFTLDGKLLRSFGTRGKAGLGENQFDKPTDIAFGPDGDMFITDGYGNSRVVRLKPDGSFRMAWGKKGDGPSEFVYPHNIVIDDSGKVYVADRGNNRIQIFTTDGRFIKQWRHLGKPFGLLLTPDQTLYVADGNFDGPHRILKLNLDGKILGEFGSTGTKAGQFKVPHSLAIDGQGNMYVAEVDNKRVQKFAPPKP